MSAHLMPEHMAQGHNIVENQRRDSLDNPEKPELCYASTDPLLRCSFFDHAWDNNPRSRAGTWEQLKPLLQRIYLPGNPGDKRSMPAISPAYYPSGVTRGRDTAAGVGLAILDYDNGAEEVIPGEYYRNARTGGSTGRPKTRKVRIPSPVTMAEVIRQLQQAGQASMAWTTWSATSDWEKFRVLIPLAHPVPVDSWTVAADWALTHLGLDQFRRGLDVPVLHNPAALAFLPGSPDPSSIRRAETSGRMLGIPLALNSGEAPRAPWTPWQNAILEARHAEREAGEHWWKAYRVNGRPVDFQSLDLAAIMESRGIKIGPPRCFKDGTKRRACCPWAGEHTGGVDDDAAVLIHTPGTWPSFQCMHSGHSHMGLRDLIEWAWGRP